MRKASGKRSNDAGRDELSARLFLRPFPASASLSGDRVVKALYSLARKSGRRVFLVGGLLRNIALKAPVGADYDIVIDADVETFAKGIARALRGTAFMLDKEAPSFRVVLRRGRGRPEAVIDISPIKGGSIENDLKQRDFTVDALGMDIASVFGAAPQVSDPTGGLGDAAKGRLVHASARVFDEDPLRVLRAVRLSQCYALEITHETRALMASRAHLLRSVSMERVRDELVAILTLPGSRASLELCYESGIIEAVLPELAGWGDVDGYDLKTHVLKTVEEAEIIAGEILSGRYLASFPNLKRYLKGYIGPLGRVALFKLSALVHDIGKPLTISRDSGRLRFMCHEQKGRELARDLLMRLKLSRKTATFVSSMAGGHHRMFALASLERPSARARSHFFRSAGADDGLMLILLALADARATRGSEDPDLLEAAGDLLSFYYATYARRRPRPLLSGEDIMEVFGVEEGREVGRIQSMISEGVESGEVSTRAGAVEYVLRRLSAGDG